VGVGFGTVWNVSVKNAELWIEMPVLLWKLCIEMPVLLWELCIEMPVLLWKFTVKMQAEKSFEKLVHFYRCRQ